MLANGNGDSFEDYIGDIIGLVYALNENAWKKFTYEVCRQVSTI